MIRAFKSPFPLYPFTKSLSIFPKPDLRSSPILVAFAINPSSSITFKAAMATLQPKALPPYVLP